MALTKQATKDSSGASGLILRDGSEFFRVHELAKESLKREVVTINLQVTGAQLYEITNT
jgi:hypothetical protein